VLKVCHIRHTNKLRTNQPRYLSVLSLKRIRTNEGRVTTDLGLSLPAVLRLEFRLDSIESSVFRFAPAIVDISSHHEHVNWYPPRYAQSASGVQSREEHRYLCSVFCGFVCWLVLESRPFLASISLTIRKLPKLILHQHSRPKGGATSSSPPTDSIPFLIHHDPGHPINRGCHGCHFLVNSGIVVSYRLGYARSPPSRHAIPILHPRKHNPANSNSQL
jgi:hypothetical protein